MWKQNGEQFERSLTTNSLVKQAGNCLQIEPFIIFRFERLEIFQSAMDAAHYVNSTTSHFLIPKHDLLNPPNRIFVYQQGNASPQASRVTKYILRENDIPVTGI